MSETIIGIRHRRKEANGLPSPTQATLHYPASNTSKVKKLGSEQEELDFIRSLDPTKNTIAIALGGSGDPLVYAASNLGIPVLRLPPYLLKEERGGNTKDDDSHLLAILASQQPNIFYPVNSRDLNFIRVRESYIALEEVMKARIAAGQRLQSRIVGSVFMREGLAPEKKLQDQIDEARMNDAVLMALAVEEKDRQKDLTSALKRVDVYSDIFEPIEGIGVRLAGRLIAGIQDIRRFPTEAKFRAYCGVHLMLSDDEWTFPRRRRGQNNNWNNLLRTAFYLCGDQFNRREGSEWGQRLRQYKAAYREKHPTEITVEVGGKLRKRYYDGHIHRMGIWKTLNKFATYIYRRWTNLDNTARGDFD